MNDRVPPPPNRAPVVLAAAMCLVSLFFAVRATKGLAWPCEGDLYRDMGAAQSMLDGRYPSDPSYEGETAWYNPLLPGIVALITRATGAPLHATYTQTGPYLNLLGPIFFFILASLLAGRRVAAVALAAYLFWGLSDQPTWFSATYSPWLWPFNFTEGLFFAALAAYIMSVRTSKSSWDVVAGLLLGVTFLSHTAPALIGALTVLVDTASSIVLRRHERPARAIRRLFVVGLLSFALSLPFLYPIFFAYHFRIVNRVPGGLVVVTARFVASHLVSLLSLGALAGVWFALRRPFARLAETSSVLFALAAVDVSLLVYALATQKLSTRYGVELPQVVPATHFYIYFQAVEHLFFGIGVVGVVEYAWSRYAKSRSASERPGLPVTSNPLVLGAILITLVAVRLPWYVASQDLSGFRRDALRYGAAHERNALYEWMMENTSPDDVFLSDDSLGLYTVGAAGRKVVSLESIYSNPYVSHERRAGDRDAMFDSLRVGDADAFAALAATYGVRYIAIDVAETSPCCQIDPSTLSRYAEVFTSGPIRVYRVAPDALRPV